MRSQPDFWKTSSNLARMRTEIPPPGPAMTFDVWSRAIVAGVRAYLPDAQAARKGSRLVIIRHGDREAHLKQDGPAWSFWITFPAAGEMKTTMASLADDRKDDFTVKNLSQSVAGYFDARFTRANMTAKA
jgi:hypothetical protein